MSDPRSPSTISGLVGWYTGLSAEVTSGSVSSWKDISGQGNHLTDITGSPVVSGSGVKSPIQGERIVAFHYGNFDNHYGDGNKATAAQNGRIYADTLSSEIPTEFGSLVSASTASGQTTYTWFPPSSVSADVLVVAGGGGGGGFGGGGGAGGVLLGNSMMLQAESRIIKIGKGGVGKANTAQVNGENGYDSTFGASKAKGGGGGGTRQSNAIGRNGTSGGSGGGGSHGNSGAVPVGGTSTQGSFTGFVEYGNSGGSGRNSTSGVDPNHASGGGGGAGGVGGDFKAGTGGRGADGGGDGGNGISISDTFSDIYGEDGYVGGGGGGNLYRAYNAPGIGGSGGGGNGGNDTPDIDGEDGIAHTGGGGGGGRWNGSNGVGGNGGSGIVIARMRVVDGRGQTQFPFLYGTTTAGLKFPTSVITTNSTYTLFHVTRYYNPTGTPTRERIFDGTTNNWLSGFHGGQAGVAHHNSWLTPETDLHGNEWVLSTDQRNMYRSNGTDRTNSAGYSGGLSPGQITINYGQTTEKSHWACAEVIAYNRVLSSAEYLSVEAYLNAKYFTHGTIPGTGVLSGSLLNAYYYNGNDGLNDVSGYPLSIGRLGRRVGFTLGTTLRISDFRNTGVLDDIPLPEAAFSLRRLFTDYEGRQACIRRSSDNLYASIYMDTGGVIVRIGGTTETNLTTWLNGATAYVTHWYDQSGNGKHLSQISTSLQPELRLDDSKYKIYFNGSNVLEHPDDAIFNSVEQTIVARSKSTGTMGDWMSYVTKISSSSARFFALWYESNHDRMLYQRYGTTSETMIYQTGVNSHLNVTRTVVARTNSSSVMSYYEDGASRDTGSGSFTANNGPFLVGGTNVIHQRFLGYIDNVMIFTSYLNDTTTATLSSSSTLL